MRLRNFLLLFILGLVFRYLNTVDHVFSKLKDSMDRRKPKKRLKEKLTIVLEKIQKAPVTTTTTTRAPVTTTTITRAPVTTTTTTRAHLEKKKPIIAICAATHSTSTWKTLSDTTLQTLMIPSIKRSITTNDKNTYDFHLYLAADHDDAFWLKNNNKIQVPNWLSLHFHFFTVPLHKIPFNQMMRKAYDDGAEYMVRINDDSQFVTDNWVSKGVGTLASYDPPNVGMVGPNCKEGNTDIMTHDMVHRTHLKIFPHYYPDVFSAWYVDDWITHVYGKKRSTKIMNWIIKHHVNTHGTRYRVDTNQRKLLDSEISKGNLRIANWLQKMKNKKVISYSLYGSDPRYTDGALANAKLIKTIYPTWRMRVYFDNTVPESIVNKLRNDDVELIDMSISNLNKMSWRFLAVSNSKYACMRDIDSRLSTREAFAVKEWIESNKKFHVMRDHPSHSNYAMSGGMWCSTEFPSMESLLKDVTNQAYLQDMTFLNNIMWPIVKKSVLQHDSFSCIKFGAKPFPTARVGWEHIGSVFINGKMREGDVDILKRAKQPCNKKQSIPNGRSNDFITNKKYISMCDVGYKTRSKNDFKLPIKPHSVICAQGSKQTLTEFFQLDIEAPFTLVTIEMDDAIPQNTAWLNHKHLKRWYSWNSNHAKVIPIPIGLNEDSQLEAMIKANVQDVKINKILVNFKQDRTERKNLFSKVKDLPYVHVETYKKKWENKHDLTAHYESISKYKWTLCPRGAGQDTHRLWEALYLGSIPIVLKSSISSLYEGLPVIQLNNWDELSLPLLEKRSKELPLSRTNAYFSHWQKKIRVGTEIEKAISEKKAPFKTKPKFITFLKDMLIQNKLKVSEVNNKLKVTQSSTLRKYECTIDINRIKVTQTKRWSDIFETNVNTLARLTRFSIDEIKQIQQRSPLPSNNDPIYIVGRDDKNVRIPEKATIIRFNQHDHNKRTTLRATWDHHLLDFIHKFGVGPNKLVKWTHSGRYVGFWNTSSPIIIPKTLWKSKQLKTTLKAKTPLYFLKSDFWHHQKNWIDCSIQDGIGLFATHILFDLKAPKTFVGISLTSDDYNFYATNTDDATRRNRWNVMIYKNIYNAISQYSTL